MEPPEGGGSKLTWFPHLKRTQDEGKVRLVAICFLFSGDSAKHNRVGLTDVLIAMEGAGTIQGAPKFSLRGVPIVELTFLAPPGKVRTPPSLVPSSTIPRKSAR
jgi:hypothetical protein